MTQDEIVGSFFIVEFMNWNYLEHMDDYWSPPSTEEVYKNTNLFPYTHYKIRDMKWHSSWDWLMLAWDKLRRAVFEENDCFYPHPFDAMTDVWGMKCTLAEKEAAFDILVQSIKWYNTTKTTNTP